MDILEQQMLLQQANAKSPGLAAVMGFFFPWLGAFYCGKIGAGLVLLFFDLVFALLSVVGIGLFLLLVYGFAGAWQCHKWAKEVNARKLQELVMQRRAAAGQG